MPDSMLKVLDNVTSHAMHRAMPDAVAGLVVRTLSHPDADPDEVREYIKKALAAGEDTHPTVWRFAATCPDARIRVLAWESPRVTAGDVAAALGGERNALVRAAMVARPGLPEELVLAAFTPMRKTSAAYQLEQYRSGNKTWPAAVLLEAAAACSADPTAFTQEQRRALEQICGEDACAVAVADQPRFRAIYRLLACGNPVVDIATLPARLAALGDQAPTDGSRTAPQLYASAWIGVLNRRDLTPAVIDAVDEVWNRPDHNLGEWRKNVLKVVAERRQLGVAPMAFADQLAAATTAADLAAVWEALPVDGRIDKRIAALLAAPATDRALAERVAADTGRTLLGLLCWHSTSGPWVWEDRTLALEWLGSVPHSAWGQAPVEFQDWVFTALAEEAVELPPRAWVALVRDERFTLPLLPRVPVSVLTDARLQLPGPVGDEVLRILADRLAGPDALGLFEHVRDTDLPLGAALDALDAVNVG